MASLVAAIVISCAVATHTDNSVYRAYPMADPNEQDTRMRTARLEAISKAELRFAVLVFVALPVGIFLARRKGPRVAGK